MSPLGTGKHYSKSTAEFNVISVPYNTYFVSYIRSLKLYVNVTYIHTSTCLPTVVLQGLYHAGCVPLAFINNVNLS